jgi:PTH1 family peptidyl-tRNA hydrolase
VTQQESAPLQLIVGLGNPGPDYAQTRHNAGAWFVEALCQDLHLSLKTESKFKAKLAQTKIAGQEIKILIPNNYMNLSGQAVGAISQYYQIPAEAILVAHDELDLPPGTIRLKTDGGHGGHNGLRDIIHHLNNRHFHRLRIGIGHPGDKTQVSNYVLNRPSKTEDTLIHAAITQALLVLPLAVQGNFGRAMNQLHTLSNES